jgi:hypothetical protein
MDAVTRRDLLNGSLSLQSLHSDFGFQLGAELSVLSHVCLLRQQKSTLGPCPNFGEYLTCPNFGEYLRNPKNLPEKSKIRWKIKFPAENPDFQPTARIFRWKF